MEKGKLTDIYDWIRPPEIREYLRKNHVLSMTEKLHIIESGICSIEKKYETIRKLYDMETDPAERELAFGMLSLYDWMYEELSTDRSGQVFVYYDIGYCEPGDVRSNRTGGILEMFRTYGEVMEHLRENWDFSPEKCNGDAEEIYHQGMVEKWCIVEGRMQEVLGLELFEMDGKVCFQRIEPLIYINRHRKLWEEKGVLLPERILFRLMADRYHNLPLPFEKGDIVCLHPPEWRYPLYGVLTIDEYGSRYIHMYFIRNYRLDSIDLGFWEFGMQGISSIQWLHPVENVRIPKDDQVLVDIGRYIKENSTSFRDSFCIMEDVVMDSGMPETAPKVIDMKPRTMIELFAEARKRGGCSEKNEPT